VDRNYYYFLDKEGVIWHEGSEIADPRFALIVHRGLTKTETGYLVRIQGENWHFQVEDVPYVVQDVALHKDENGHLRQVDLIFPGGYTEILDPSTLRVSPENVLYSKVRNGLFDARFSRKSFFHLSSFFEEDAVRHSYTLPVGGKAYAIKQSA
jgi:hypothetical protein